jgi:hypothetical protein
LRHLSNREFLIWKERGKRGERWAGQQAAIFMVRFERDRKERQRYKEIERHINKETERQS